MKKSVMLALTMSILLGVTTILPAYASFPLSFFTHKDAKTSFSHMLEKVMPGVVNVIAQGDLDAAHLAMLAPSFNSDNNTSGSKSLPNNFVSLGSGVIVDAREGYIITNAHVIRDAKTITVTLSDGRVFKAKLMGIDTETDIAILKINGDHLTNIPLGNSDNLEVGDFVAAIGNPYGLDQTVTSGIVSALQRNSVGIEGYENFIQTDAPINSGNSGGALINMQGQVIGINTAILTPGPNSGSVGIGFAIPIHMAQGVMQQLIKYGSVKRGVVGILLQNVNPSLALALNLPSSSKGGIITLVTENSPAAKAGLKEGDIIQSVNGISMQNAGQIRNAVGMLRVGDTVELRYLRNSKTASTKLTITDPKQTAQLAENNNPFLYGLALRNVDQTIVGKGRILGVEVIYVDPNSMASRSGINLGDVIVSANMKPISTIEQLQQVAGQAKDQLLVNIRSSNGPHFVVIQP